MVNKQSFAPDEWNKILESPVLTGMAVSAADPNGLWGRVSEAEKATLADIERALSAPA